MTTPRKADGYCECGCGQKTWVATYNSPHHGYVAGQPVRFKRGHNGSNNKGGRVTARKGYVMIWKPDHRLAVGGYVLEHRAIADNAMAGRLPDTAPVHHVDGDPANNSPSNLVVCQDNAYHKILHLRAKAKAECGHAGWRRCYYCKEYDHPDNLRFYDKSVVHPECSSLGKARPRVPAAAVQLSIFREVA